MKSDKDITKIKLVTFFETQCSCATIYTTITRFALYVVRFTNLHPA